MDVEAGSGDEPIVGAKADWHAVKMVAIPQIKGRIANFLLFTKNSTCFIEQRDLLPRKSVAITPPSPVHICQRLESTRKLTSQIVFRGTIGGIFFRRRFACREKSWYHCLGWRFSFPLARGARPPHLCRSRLPFQGPNNLLPLHKLLFQQSRVRWPVYPCAVALLPALARLQDPQSNPCFHRSDPRTGLKDRNRQR